MRNAVLDGFDGAGYPVMRAAGWRRPASMEVTQEKVLEDGLQT
jgi:hypothetical protein